MTICSSSLGAYSRGEGFLRGVGAIRGFTVSIQSMTDLTDLAHLEEGYVIKVKKINTNFFLLCYSLVHSCLNPLF